MALRFRWYHIFTPQRKKVYKANVEHDACIGVRVLGFFSFLYNGWLQVSSSSLE